MQLEPLERNVACGVELDRWPRPAPILMNEQQQNRCRSGPAIELDATRYVTTLQRLQLHDSAFRIFSIVVSLFCCFFQVWS